MAQDGSNSPERRDPLLDALRESGGVAAPPTASARLARLLTDALRHSQSELRMTRSGYRRGVTVAFAAGKDLLLAVVPVFESLRVDPEVVTERGWLVTAAAVGTLVRLAPPRERLTRSGQLRLQVGAFEDSLLLAYPAYRFSDAVLQKVAPTVFSEEILGVERLRIEVATIPNGLLGEPNHINLRRLGQGALKRPAGSIHPLQVAEAVARLGGRPAAEHSVSQVEETVLKLFEGHSIRGTRPHDEEDRSLRIARRMLQRLSGMGKWGGYHTEFVHLGQGFPGQDRSLALKIAEALIVSGLLVEKRSVGQRHVYLNPRRAGEIYRLIESGQLPPGLSL